jgi:Protein of unknown function (DUF3455)
VQVAQAGPPSPSVPGPIQVLDGSKVFLIGHAVGVQIYSCNGSVWSSAVPRANLFDDHGKLIITHFAGPTWQAKDGSMVVGHAEASVTVDDTAIPWVRLSAASTTPGRLGNTTNIQRIATTGGYVPPAADCNATTAGTVAEVPYTADRVRAPGCTPGPHPKMASDHCYLGGRARREMLKPASARCALYWSRSPIG